MLSFPPCIPTSVLHYWFQSLISPIWITLPGGEANRGVGDLISSLLAIVKSSFEHIIWPLDLKLRIFKITQLVENLPAMQETPVQFLDQEDPLEKRWATHSSILGLPWWLSWLKKSTSNTGDLGFIPGWGRPPGGGHGNPLQYSCLKNPHGQRSLAGYSPWVCKQLNMTEWLGTAQHRKKEQMKERRSTERKNKYSSNCWMSK